MTAFLAKILRKMILKRIFLQLQQMQLFFHESFWNCQSISMPSSLSFLSLQYSQWHETGNFSTLYLLYRHQLVGNTFKNAHFPLQFETHRSILLQEFELKCRTAELDSLKQCHHWQRKMPGHI